MCNLEMSYLNVRRKGHCVIWTAVAPLKALNQILQVKIIAIFDIFDIIAIFDMRLILLSYFA